MIGSSGTRELSSDWPHLVAEHARAVEEYRLVAGAIERTRWTTPIAPGKWSPAEITAHVAEAYRVLSGELAGANGMRLKGSRLQRLVLRYTMLPQLLRGKPFPPGVRAPRETCPAGIIEDPALAVATLVKRAEQFTRELTATASQNVRLTHAYFGKLSSRQGLALSTAHTRHHARQLAAISRSPLPS